MVRKSITPALILLGLFDALYLLYTYTSPSRPMVCIGTGCDAVRASAYSTPWGIPMPVFGVFGYTLLAIVIVAESLFSGRVARMARHLFLEMTGFGFLFSLYLDYLQAFAIHAYCAWCLTSGAVMTVLFVLALVDVSRAGPEPEPAMELAHVRSLFAVGMAAVLAGVPAFYLLARHGHLPPASPQTTAASLAERLVRPVSHEAGNPQALLTVVEFGDFECPVCGRGEAAAREVRTRFAHQIRFVFRQFPLERIHFLAEKAAEASECAGEQGKFWEMVEKIYSRQGDLFPEGLERDAAELGLDQRRFNQCLTSGAMAGRVRRDMEDGRALGVRATPTFFIGREMIEGVMTAEQFSQAVSGQLARLGVSVGGNVEQAAMAPVAQPKSPVRKTAAASQPVPPSPLPTQPLPGTQTANTDLAQGAIVLPGVAPSVQGAPPIFGRVQTAGGGCSEADAVKKQPELIDTKAVRQLLSDHAAPVFVDVRPAGDYAAGRIPGAINIPADKIGQQWNTLPKDRTIVIYESGGTSGDVCAAGRASGRTLLEHGLPYSQVKVYRDGLAGWKQAGTDTDK